VSLRVGQYVWVPCEVKAGAFSDERMVRVNSPAIQSSSGRWIGFVATEGLREAVTVGSTDGNPYRSFIVGFGGPLGAF